MSGERSPSPSPPAGEGGPESRMRGNRAAHRTSAQSPNAAAPPPPSPAAGEDELGLPGSAPSPSPLAGEGGPEGRMRGKPRLRTFAREMRSAPTDAEAMLWENLRGRGLAGAKFRRQVPIGRYIVDFLCPAARLIVELDGGIHRGSDYDRDRDSDLRRLGFQVLRIRNERVASEIGSVLADIRQATAQPPHPAAPPPPSPARGEGRRRGSENTP